MSDIALRNATRLHRTPFPTTLCWFVTNAAAAMLVKRTYLYPFAQELNSFVCKIILYLNQHDSLNMCLKTKNF